MAEPQYLRLTWTDASRAARAFWSSTASCAAWPGAAPGCVRLQPGGGVAPRGSDVAQERRAGHPGRGAKCASTDDPRDPETLPLLTRFVRAMHPFWNSYVARARTWASSSPRSTRSSRTSGWAARCAASWCARTSTRPGGDATCAVGQRTKARRCRPGGRVRRGRGGGAALSGWTRRPRRPGVLQGFGSMEVGGPLPGPARRRRDRGR